MFHDCNVLHTVCRRVSACQVTQYVGDVPAKVELRLPVTLAWTAHHTCLGFLSHTYLELSSAGAPGCWG